MKNFGICGRSARMLVVAAASLTLWPAASAAQNTPALPTSTPGIMSSTTVTGSGTRYTTTVDSKTEGDLKPEDLRQVSVWGSRILLHVDHANRDLGEGQPEKAKAELEDALSLARMVHELLPVTVVSTTVKDSKGAQVYRHEDRVQPDRIPIFRGMVAVEVVQPIIDAKRQEAALRGVQLADTEIVHTSVLLDLDFVERRIRRALAQLGQPKDALAALQEAQAKGVIFTAHKEDNPLVEAQSALRLAEQQVRDGKFDGANANLQLARVQLETYRTLVGDSAGQSVTQLNQEISALQQKIREPGAADTIRGFWNRVTGWFRAEPGKTEQTTEKKS